jgi:hypothetical protein
MIKEKTLMKQLSILLAVSFSAACSPVAQNDFPVLTGKYLGQTTPGLNVEMFAPEIVSTGMPELGIAVSPDGDEIFFHVFVKGIEALITTRLESGQWTEPEVAPFASRFSDGWPSFHPDGSKLFFHSNRALDNSDTKDSVGNIWYVERSGSGWGEPKPVAAPVNGNGFVCCASVTETGTLYYTKRVENGENIFRSRFVDGRYATPEPLPEIINAREFQIHAVIAPDESYLVIPLGGRDDAINSAGNYYAFFRDADDTWSDPINLGETINDGRTGGIPSFSSDGEYFFFEANSERDYLDEFDTRKTYSELQDIAISRPSHRSGDIFWINAAYIDNLRPGGIED